MQGCTSLENIKSSTDKIQSFVLYLRMFVTLNMCKKFPQNLTKLQQKRNCGLCDKPSTVQTRKHIGNKSLGNQLKMARDQKLMKSSSFEGMDTSQLTSVLPPSSPPSPSKMLLEHLSE